MRMLLFLCFSRRSVLPLMLSRCGPRLTLISCDEIQEFGTCGGPSTRFRQTKCLRCEKLRFGEKPVPPVVSVNAAAALEELIGAPGNQIEYVSCMFRKRSSTDARSTSVLTAIDDSGENWSLIVYFLSEEQPLKKEAFRGQTRSPYKLRIFCNSRLLALFTFAPLKTVASVR